MITHITYTKGSDDLGNFYSSHSQLDAAQTANRTKWYAANDKFWAGAGYGGKNDNEVNLLSLSVYIGNIIQNHTIAKSLTLMCFKSYLPIVYAQLLCYTHPIL